MSQKTPSSKRIDVKVSDSLADRLTAAANALQMNPNQFVNRCVEGCVLAMYADKPEMPQIVELYRKNFGRDRDLIDRVVLRLVHLIAPNYEQIPDERKKILFELVADYDGPLDEKARVKLQRKARDLFEKLDAE